MRRFTMILAACCCVLFATGRPASAGIILVGDTAQSTSNLGDFWADLTYSFSSANAAQLVVKIKNTGPAGFLTGFVFNNPDNLITSVSMSATTANFNLLGGPNFNNNAVIAAPFGFYDIGASTGANWEGGGPPSNGLAAGVMETFTFSFIGNGLDGLTTVDFINELALPPEGHGATFFVARFRGFEPSGSDKVPAAILEAPEPAAWLVYSLMAITVGGAWWWKRRSRNGPIHAIM